MAKCLFCTIRPRCLRFASGILAAHFARFAPPPPALNNFRHPWIQGVAMSGVTHCEWSDSL